jgi:UDP-perosamine 4-acetyltransferase
VARRRERFLIWGGGGHGKVVADLVRSLRHELVGFVDMDPSKLGKVVEPGGARVILSQEEFEEAVRERGSLPAGIDALVLAIGNNEIRGRYARSLGELALPPLVHPSAVVSPSARLGRGAVVFPRAVINAEAEIGPVAIVNSGAIVEHDCVIGWAAHVSPGAVVAGGARVGHRSWVGAGAIVLPGIEIGSDVIVGAGAVVLKDVADHSTVVGVPARSIR